MKNLNLRARRNISVPNKETWTPQEAVKEIKRITKMRLGGLPGAEKEVLLIIENLEADAYTRGYEQGHAEGIEDGRQGK